MKERQLSFDFIENQEKRVETLCVVIKDKNKASWIWDNHLKNKNNDNLGISIKSISHGDILNKYEKALDLISELEKLGAIKDNFIDKVDSFFEELD